MSDSLAFEMVVGLEVHAELCTQTKIFCGCATAYGAPPNSQCCPVCAGTPGALPRLNQDAVELAVRAGLATHCTIAPRSTFDRKHYTYPDLPKGYQITQFETPLCQNGYLDIATQEGEKRIGITRIHMEEDAAKLSHNEERGTLVDLNRSGVPLVEVVSAPDMRSPQQAVAYLKKLHATLVYAGVTNGKMNEGSFRCDVNLSVRKQGESALGTRTEIKNLNSFAFVDKAIRHEFDRQVRALGRGEAIVQETRRFDAASGATHSMRAKEDAGDYRYCPEPDLPPVFITKDYLQTVAEALPPLPDARKKAYQAQYGLPAHHCEALVLDKDMADLFEAAAPLTPYPQVLVSLILTEVLRLAGQQDGLPKGFLPSELAEVATLLGQGRLNSSSGKKLVETLWQKGGTADAWAQKLNLWQLNDPGELRAAAAAALKENPKILADYQKGKTAALKALMGKAMAKTGGRANPEALGELLLQLANSSLSD
ncbi:Asp-tRNA(Asn)/Glu-tRNA(Gln) amidotransferase subunit GatB [Clostridia bacterium OttesenSCG-928-O13]|nr:Asp-tRNA(Asn)/Glu-tRNA(Gln) amidotransferase subunit GatB [Clostridia bacterium OttesenSCG-928-O13]